MNGLATAFAMPISNEAKQRAAEMGITVAKFVLECFRNYAEGGSVDPVWATPYLVPHDRGPATMGPSWGLTDWCLGSIQLLKKHLFVQLTTEEQEKTDQILEQFIQDVMPPSGGGWPERWEWLIY